VTQTEDVVIFLISIFRLSATRVDSWEGEAPAEPCKSLDINRSSGLAGASPSLPIEILNRNGGESVFLCVRSRSLHLCVESFPSNKFHSLSL